jgi:hypothetical protein
MKRKLNVMNQTGKIKNMSKVDCVALFEMTPNSDNTAENSNASFQFLI